MEGKLYQLIKANFALIQLGLIISFIIQISWAFYMNPDISFVLCISLALTTNLKGVFLIAFWVSPVGEGVSVFLFLVVSGLIGIETSVIAFNLETSYLYTGLLTCATTVTGVVILIGRTYQNVHLGGAEKPTLAKKTSNVIGIFSRSAHEDYEWLINHLRKVGSIHPFYVGNNNHMDFRKAVSNCTFGILYHSKTRGRLNITDVTDSIYDKELKYLSDVLGKEKVVVVVDDLDDSSAQSKARILKSQPSIDKLAKDVFLFSTADKHKTGLIEKVGPLISLIQSGGSWFPAGTGWGASVGEGPPASRIINTPQAKAGGWGQVSVILLISEWLYFLFYSPASDEIYTILLIVLSNANGLMLLSRYIFSSASSKYELPLYVKHPTRQKLSTQQRWEQKGQFTGCALAFVVVVAVCEFYVIYGILALTATQNTVLSIISIWKVLFVMTS